MKFAYHQEIELEITTLTNMGQGLGRVDGWVVLVPFALPGEKVKARIYKNEKNFSQADLLEVLRPSPHRIAPRCPLFGRCGGCQYQNFAYEEQLVWKRRQVSELLRHMAGLEAAVEPVFPSPRPFGYRSKITPHFDRLQNGMLGPIGFQQVGKGRRLIDVEQCPIATDGINAALPAIRAATLAKAGEFKRGATLLVREADGEILTDPKSTARERVGELVFEFLASDFFQNNPFILPAFVEYAVSEAKRGGARYLVDAYCGSGLFSLAGAKVFEKVIGVEVSQTAVVRASQNARRNGLKNCDFHAGSAESIFASVPFPPEATTVIIDPPRAGCSVAFLEQLFHFGPARVVYVSCNPATQMRDLKLFLPQGYAVAKVQPFDLFPQTKHLECVLTLQRSHGQATEDEKKTRTLSPMP